jgi:hypothetical protein
MVVSMYPIATTNNNNIIRPTVSNEESLYDVTTHQQFATAVSEEATTTSFPTEVSTTVRTEVVTTGATIAEVMMDSGTTAAPNSESLENRFGSPSPYSDATDEALSVSVNEQTPAQPVATSAATNNEDGDTSPFSNATEEAISPIVSATSSTEQDNNNKFASASDHQEQETEPIVATLRSVQDIINDESRVSTPIDTSTGAEEAGVVLAVERTTSNDEEDDSVTAIFRGTSTTPNILAYDETSTSRDLILMDSFGNEEPGITLGEQSDLLHDEISDSILIAGNEGEQGASLVHDENRNSIVHIGNEEPGITPAGAEQEGAVAGHIATIQPESLGLSLVSDNHIMMQNENVC